MFKAFTIKLFVALLVSTFLVGSAWANAGDPKVVVESAVNGIIKVLEAREDVTKLTEKNRDDIRAVVAGRFDYAEMAKRSLAQTWSEISAKEQVDFTELFRKLLERSYGNRLASFRDQKVVFEEAEYKNDKARVKTSVIDTQKSTPVEYRLHNTATGWQVYDIKIEGVSLVSNFRNDFQEGLRSNGGFNGLYQALEEKVKKLEEKDNA